MTGQERRARQAEIEREFAEDMAARPNVATYRPPPSTDSPDYCTVSRSGRHACWTSKKDQKRRCYHCCAIVETTGPAASPTGPTQHAG